MSRKFPEAQPLTGGWRDDPAWPDVDVVMPIRNEFDHLEAAIESVRAQDYPGGLRIFLGVGPSEDDTEELAAKLADDADDLVVVNNPSGRTPSALNVAIRAGSAPVVVRFDGHSVLCDGYVAQAVEALRSTGAANVGGRQVPQPRTQFEGAVAAATTSWLGTGGASYRVGGKPAQVDTVYLGVFDRAAIEAVGLFDERLIRNQDYELNIRLRKAGGIVWFDPELWVGYRLRGSWRALATQYYEYGFWKARVLQLHPESLRARQLLPPFAIMVAMLGLLGSSLRRPLILAPVSYVLVLGAGSRARPRVGAALGAIHVSWTFGLLRGATRSFADAVASGRVLRQPHVLPELPPHRNVDRTKMMDGTLGP